MKTLSEFHIHVYFDLNNKQKACDVYNAMSQSFPSTILMGSIHDQPIGPHTKPMFSASLISDMMFGPMINWLMFNRQGLSVLVHPISDDDLTDHTEHALWLGQPVALDLNKL